MLNLVVGLAVDSKKCYKTPHINLGNIVDNSNISLACYTILCYNIFEILCLLGDVMIEGLVSVIMQTYNS